MSSGAGSIDGIEGLKVKNTVRGRLKFVTRRIHAENERFTAFQ
jgi:hypothetical protein